MQDTEAQQLLLEILEQAEQKKFVEFRLIKSWSEFMFYRKSRTATKLIIKALDQSSRDLIKSYCKQVESGTSDVSWLLAYSELKDVIAFYEKDLETLQKMLDEFDNWLGQGHFFYSILGGERDIWN
jgi:hypothetical protein